jgi:putative phosphoribosyl transferase
MAYFVDRVDAGKRLAEALADFHGKNAAVLAIPRGGVVVGYEIAAALVLPLDVIVPRKLGAPDNPELAIGAIAEDGSTVFDDKLIAYLGVSQDYIQEESDRQRQEIARRMKLYREGGPSVGVAGKDIIVVDDGIATGSTMKAALTSIRNREAKSVTVAVPVGPTETIQELRRLADKVVYLYLPDYFHAIGQFYEDFSQTSDEEVINLLRLSREGLRPNPEEVIVR